MKKIIIVIVVLIIALAGWIVYYQFFVPKIPIEKLFPRDAVVYLKISGLEKGLKEFKDTKLWKNIREMNISEIMTRSGASQEQIDQYTMAAEKIKEWHLALLVNEFLGQEVALAVYPGITEDAIIELADIIPNVVLVARLKPKTDFAVHISKLYNKFSDNVSVESEKYRDYDVFIIDIDDQSSIVYAKIEDLLVSGLSQSIVYDCIDTWTENKPALLDDKNYLSVRAKLPPKAQVVAYVNLESILSKVLQFTAIFNSESSDSDEDLRIQDMLDSAKGIQAVGFGSVFYEDIAENKMVLTVDRNHMSPTFKNVYNCPRQTNNAVSFIPKDIIGFQWSSCLDARITWDAFIDDTSLDAEQLAQKKEMLESIENFESNAGLSFKDEIIPAIGNESGVYLAEIDTEGFFPLPSFVFFLKANEREVFQDAINSLAQNYGLDFTSENHKDIRIQYATIPFINIQPGYCFLGDYLLVATNQSLLKDSIDAYKDRGMSILTNKTFQKVNIGLTDKNNAVFFLHTNKLLNKLRNIADWAINWIPSQPKKERAKLEQQLEDLRMKLHSIETGVSNYSINLQSLKVEIAKMQDAGQDVAEKKAKYKSLEKRISYMNEDIKSTKKIEKGMVERLQYLKEEKFNLQEIGFYLTKIIDPILEGIAPNKAVATKTVFSDSAFESTTFFLWQKGNP